MAGDISPGRNGLNRAVALRIAACGILGLGAALLIAALLLMTYTKSKITKIPLDLDATLVSDGTGTAFDPASLSAPKFEVSKNSPVSQQQQISVEAPSGLTCTNFPRYRPSARWDTTSTSAPAAANARSSIWSKLVVTISGCAPPRTPSSPSSSARKPASARAARYPAVSSSIGATSVSGTNRPPYAPK